MPKYAVNLSGIIEADNEVEAIQIFKESSDYRNVECFAYNPHQITDKLDDLNKNQFIESMQRKVADHVAKRIIEDAFNKP